jgi:hypothetical protein
LNLPDEFEGRAEGRSEGGAELEGETEKAEALAGVSLI